MNSAILLNYNGFIILNYNPRTFWPLSSFFYATKKDNTLSHSFGHNVHNVECSWTELQECSIALCIEGFFCAKFFWWLWWTPVQCWGEFNQNDFTKDVTFIYFQGVISLRRIIQLLEEEEIDTESVSRQKFFDSAYKRH